MAAIADFVVESPDRKTLLLVEAKTKVPASSEWAARLRRNLFANLPAAPSRFFLLALPERFYLWKDAVPDTNAPPDYEIDAQLALKRYVDKLHTPLTELGYDAFLFLVGAWLDDIVHSKLDRSQVEESDRWLVTSGLYDALKHGLVKAPASL